MVEAALSGVDVERDGDGRIVVHGTAVMAWASEIMYKDFKPSAAWSDVPRLGCCVCLAYCNV